MGLDAVLQHVQQTHNPAPVFGLILSGTDRSVGICAISFGESADGVKKFFASGHQHEGHGLLDHILGLGLIDRVGIDETAGQAGAGFEEGEDEFSDLAKDLPLLERARAVAGPLLSREPPGKAQPALPR